MFVSVALIAAALLVGAFAGKQRERSRIHRRPRLVAMSLVADKTLQVRRYEHHCGRLLERADDECVCGSRMAAHPLYKIA